MKKINILKESSEYNRIIQNVKPFKYNDFIIFKEENEDIIYKFGFSVGKKIGNAVIRNKIKRQLKNIIDKKNYKNGFKCIIMVKRSIVEKNYSDIEKDLYYCLDKINIYKGDKNEKEY